MLAEDRGRPAQRRQARAASLKHGSAGRNGNLRQLALLPLAVSSRERQRELPGARDVTDVTTMQELGYKGFDISFWSGAFAHTATPADVVKKPSEAKVEASKDAAVRARLEPFGSVVVSTPDALAPHIRRETAMLAEVIRQAGTKAK